MADNKQAFQAGHTTGKAEEKSNVVMDKIKGAASGAQVPAQQAGKNISETGGGAVNLVKEKTGMK